MSGLTDFLLGSSGNIGWQELQRMMFLQKNLNADARQGMFTGWEYDYEERPIYNKDGKVKGYQRVPVGFRQTATDAFKPAIDRLGGRAASGAPGQFADLAAGLGLRQRARYSMPLPPPPNTGGGGQLPPDQLPPDQLPPPPMDTAPVDPSLPPRPLPPGVRPGRPDIRPPGEDRPPIYYP
jgi:hypothetical protein